MNWSKIRPFVRQSSFLRETDIIDEEAASSASNRFIAYVINVYGFVYSFFFTGFFYTVLSCD